MPPNSFCILKSPSGKIDTPWPLEIEDYEAVALLPAEQMPDTIRHSLMEDPFLPSPICMLHAKASALLHRAALINRVTAFWESLPPIYPYYGNNVAARALAITHALTAASAIRLHRSSGATDTQAQTKCLFAVHAILDCLGDARVGAQAIVHPVVGALCALACQVLMDEITSVRAFRTTWAVSIGADEAARTTKSGTEEAALVAELHVGMTTMGVYAAGCPLIGGSSSDFCGEGADWAFELLAADTAAAVRNDVGYSPLHLGLGIPQPFPG
ncbi:hypothetical protein B0H13DRAFT_1881653 [Mycena leptocephala]|nr:hypothetical protein B0H13DRAFT_1881653 [Mycena leptocephala]